MAFPTTGILDNFNRANTGPPPSSSWTNDLRGVGSGGLAVISNQCGGTASVSNNGAYWNVATFTDAECRSGISVLPAVNDDMNWYVRVTSPGSSLNGYRVRYKRLSGTDSWYIYRLDSGGSTQLGATVSQDAGAGDSGGAEIIGNTIKAFYKASGGSWTELMARTDSTHAGPGYIGLTTDNTTGRFDDFGGGTVVTSTQLVVNDTTCSVAFDSVALVQHSALIINDLTSSNTFDNVQLQQKHIILINDFTSGLSFDNVVLIENKDLLVDELLSSAIVDNISITQHHVLLTDELNSGCVIDNIPLQQNINLIIDDLVLSTKFDNVRLTGLIKLYLYILNINTENRTVTIFNELRHAHSGHRYSVEIQKS